MNYNIQESIIQVYRSHRQSILAFFYIHLLNILIFTTAFCQAPSCFNYQAVLRNDLGEIRANAEVIIQISIIQGDASGTIVFNETHDVTTNNLGMVNLIIGSIEPTSFASINWANGPYFLKITVDNREMGTTQLLSVPYALYAASGVGEQGPIGPQGPQGPQGLQGIQGPAVTDATALIKGTLSTARYSAYEDLNIEGRLNNSSSQDLLLREQADDRYNIEVGFFAYNTGHDIISLDDVVSTKVQFDHEVFDDGSCYNNSTNEFVAPMLGVYDFSASADVYNLDGQKYVFLYLFVNGALYSKLACLHIDRGTSCIITGSLTTFLNRNDTVDIRVLVNNDGDYNITGSETKSTHFCGHLVYRYY